MGRRADTGEQQSRQGEQAVQEGRQTIHHLQAQLEALSGDLQQAKQEKQSLAAHYQVRHNETHAAQTGSNGIAQHSTAQHS